MVKKPGRHRALGFSNYPYFMFIVWHWLRDSVFLLERHMTARSESAMNVSRCSDSFIPPIGS